MKTAVVGINWGHVHINAFRQLGHEVAAVVAPDPDKCSAVARQYGIAHAFTSIEELAQVGPDLVSLAVPAHVHGDAIRKALQLGCAVVCEKPVLGYSGRPETYRELPEGIFFNYAYPFLQDIGIFYDRLSRFDRIGRIVIDCAYNLELNRPFTPEEMFYETVSHLISLIVHRIPADSGAVRSDEQTICVTSSGGTFIEIRCRRDESLSGISHNVTVEGSCGGRNDVRLILSGSFTTGSNWHYLPVSFNGEAVSGEYFPQEDPWYTANRKSLGNIAEYVQGRQSLEQTLENGAFNLQKAMMVERILDCLKPRQYRMD